jgi:hypothetical protein
LLCYTPTIGSNLTLKDKKLNIDKLHQYLLIENELAAQCKLYEGLEPEKDGFEQRKEAVFASSIPNWLCTWEDVRLEIITNNKALTSYKCEG